MRRQDVKPVQVSLYGKAPLPKWLFFVVLPVSFLIIRNGLKVSKQKTLKYNINEYVEV